MKKYVQAAHRRRGYTYDYAGAGYVRKVLTLIPTSSYDYDYSRGGEAYICYFSDADGAEYAYYCQNPESPIFCKIDEGDLRPMKISCQVKDPLEYPADSSKHGKVIGLGDLNWILRPRLLK